MIPAKPTPSSRRKVISPKDMPDETGLSERGVWREVENGRLKPPIQIGKRRVGFLADEVDQWRAARIAERDANLAAGIRRLAAPNMKRRVKPEAAE